MAKTEKSKKKTDPLSLEDVPGLGPIGIEKLAKAGIFTKMDMMVRSFIDIAEVTGLRREDAEKAKIYCRDRLIEANLLWPKEMTAAQLLEKRKTVEFVKSGSNALDELLRGGFECMAVNEISGPFRSGKTQMVLSLAVQALQKKDKGGLDKEEVYCQKCGLVFPQQTKHCDNCKGKLIPYPSRVLYIDTEGTCRPERMRDIILGKGYAKTEEEVNEMLNRIIVQKPHDAPHLVLMLEYGAKLIRELNIRMIIVDSATMFYRQEMAEMGDSGRKFRLLNQMNGLLRNLAENFNLAVIYVNQVYESTDAYHPGQKIYGGNVVGHAMTYRLALKKRNKTWIATTLDYPHIPEEDVEFLITDAGITDIKKKKSEHAQ